MKTILLLLSIILFSCDNEILNPVAVIDKPFWLRFGQSKILEPAKLAVQFQQILGDSRCPLEVMCFWEGQAQIRLLLQQTELESTVVDLSIFGYVTRADTLRHLSKDTLDYHITLMQLDPYPEHLRQNQPSEYKALVKISRL